MLKALYKQLFIKYMRWKLKRKWTPELQLENLIIVLIEDNRWLANDPTISALTDKYLDLLRNKNKFWSAEHHLRNFSNVLDNESTFPNLPITTAKIIAYKGRYRNCLAENWYERRNLPASELRETLDRFIRDQLSPERK